MDTHGTKKGLGNGPLSSDPSEGPDVPTGPKSGFTTKVSSRDLEKGKAGAAESQKAPDRPEKS